MLENQIDATKFRHILEITFFEKMLFLPYLMGFAKKFSEKYIV